VSDTPRGGPAIPPPGFNVKEAKKPLPKEREAVKSAKPSDASGASELSADAARGANPALREATTTAIAKEEVKDEKTLRQLAGSEAKAKVEEKKAVGEAKKAQQKLTITQKIKKELIHYWDGTKLLGAEIKISTRLALKVAAGYELSRRENRQVGFLYYYFFWRLFTGKADDEWLSCSFKEQYRIWRDWFHSLSSSSFPLQNCSFLSP
jgi:LETM1 and EF-hand domain-containing protein 1